MQSEAWSKGASCRLHSIHIESPPHPGGRLYLEELAQVFLGRARQVPRNWEYEERKELALDSSSCARCCSEAESLTNHNMMYREYISILAIETR